MGNKAQDSGLECIQVGIGNAACRESVGQRPVGAKK